MDPQLPQTTDAYLERIGATRPAHPDAEALRELQLRHLTTVPFENLSIHLGEDIVLEEKALLDKIVADRRGGFCYEVNGAFAVLLRSLGFRVTLLQARVHGDGGRLGIPYDHMALRVETDDGTGPWLADVGFGDHAQNPLVLDDRTDQVDPRGIFRIAQVPAEGGEDYGEVDVLQDGAPQFRLDPRPRALDDFRVGAWYHRTSPESSFTRSPVCSRFTTTGRITLKGHKLLTTVGAERHETRLESDQEVLDAYREYFGVRLDRLPAEGGVGVSVPNG
jgi:N-hydroxyarylamine O-acetyltransferase